MLRHLLVVAAWVAVAAAASAGEPAWKYVTDDAFRPVARSVPLSDAKPDDLREDVAYRGKKRKYAQVRYGSEDSRRVVVVVDEVGPDDWDLYVDADRNRVIEAKDKVAGKGRERSARLDVEITRGLEIVHEPRTVRWRLGTAGTSISLATLGYVAGHVQLGGKKIAARRVDGDANGLFADAADRLWLDLNGDGEWDPITEQFPLLPVLTLNGQRHSVRGDAAGTKLAIEPLTAEGRIRLRLEHLDKDATVVKLQVMLVGEDGAAFSVTSVDAPIVVPVGKYALGAVSLSVQHADATLPAHFIFSRTGLDSTVRWHELKKDQELILDPIGKLRFDLDIEPGGKTAKAGGTLRVQPQLFTADGLLINSCSHGESDQTNRYGGQSSLLKLCDAKGQPLETATSGFA
jgi:hypothetical protein